MHRMHVQFWIPGDPSAHDKENSQRAGNKGRGMSGARSEEASESHKIEHDAEKDADGGHGIH